MEQTNNTSETLNTTPSVTTTPSKQNIQTEKIKARINALETALLYQKKAIDISIQEVKSLKKIYQKSLNKSQKTKNKPKEGRKPHGFAVPTAVSEELCLFMGKEPGTDISRTDVTKFLTEYISSNKLQNPANKRQVLPDESLMSLFGDAAKDVFLTHFTMQKYINRHFLNSKKNKKEENVVVVSNDTLN